MLAQHTTNIDHEAFASYARSLHEYTLRLWADSIRTAEEATRVRMAAKGVEMKKEEGRAHKAAVRAAGAA